MKYLALAAVLGFVYFVFFRKKLSKDEKKSSEDMVKCTKCGTYLTMGEAIIGKNNFFCSQECKEKA